MAHAPTLAKTARVGQPQLSLIIERVGQPACSRSRFKRAPNDATATPLARTDGAGRALPLSTGILMNKYKVGVGSGKQENSSGLRG